MAPEEIQVIEECLLEVAREFGPISCLEWGAGGSTLHFASLVASKHQLCHWLAIEYNAKWYEKVCEATSHIRGVDVKLFDVGNPHLRQRYTNMDEYVTYPATLGRKWDFILVDGRKRRRCLLEAQQLLRPNGIVVLHDADREYYHCALDGFSGEFVLPTVWIGRIKSSGERSEPVSESKP